MKLRIAILMILLILIASLSQNNTGALRTIQPKVYAKGKAKKIKKKKLIGYENLGEYILTAYCGCSKCSGGWGSKTSTGTTCKAGRTIAVDPKVIPYGTKVIINKHEYTAEDCGGGIKGKHIDIYFDSHSEALQFGRQKAVVYKKPKKKIIAKIKNIKRMKLCQVARKN